MSSGRSVPSDSSLDRNLKDTKRLRKTKTAARPSLHLFGVISREDDCLKQGGQTPNTLREIRTGKELA